MDTKTKLRFTIHFRDNAVFFTYIPYRFATPMVDVYENQNSTKIIRVPRTQVLKQLYGY